MHQLAPGPEGGGKSYGHEIITHTHTHTHTQREREREREKERERKKKSSWV